MVEVKNKEFQKKKKKKQVYKKKPDWKNDTGKPAFYKTPKDLQKKIDAYFAWWHRWKVIGKDAQDNDIKIPMITMTDLAIYLWFDSRQSIYDYEKDMWGEFPYIIRRARLFIEREYEERLWSTTPTWAIFALKNMWWRDKSEQEITGANWWPVAIQKVERSIMDNNYDTKTESN